MARRIAQSIGGASTLSYIDIISGGFGSAFFLLLIFMSFPIDTASTPSSGSRFLDIWIEWTDEKASAYIEVAYTPEQPAGLLPQTFRYTLNSQSFFRSSATGLVTYSGAAPKFWIGLAEAGYSQTGTGALGRSDGGIAKRGQWLRFSDPCPGDFKFYVGSASPGGLIDLLANKQTGRTAIASARIMVSSGSAVEFFPDVPPATLETEFRTGLGEKPVEFVFASPIIVSAPRSGGESSLLHCEDN